MGSLMTRLRDFKLPETSEFELSLESFRMELMRIELTEDADIDQRAAAEAEMMKIYEDYSKFIRSIHSESGNSTVAPSKSMASTHHGYGEHMNRFKAAALVAKNLEGHYWSAINQDTVSPYCVQLPLINRDKLQDRFHAIGGKVFVVVRDCYSSMKELFFRYPLIDTKRLSRIGGAKVEEDHDTEADSAHQGSDKLQISEWNSFYLTGPKGVGKSYLLYLLVCELRQHQSMYRVTYIHDCEAWRVQPYEYILEELVMTFCHEDKMDITSRASAVLELTADARETSFNQLVFEVREFMKGAKLQWVVVADQYNALCKSSRPAVDDAPFSVLKTWASLTDVMLIVSASANNENFRKDLRYFTPHDIGVRSFDDMEFRLWYNNSGLCVDDDIIKEARFWTGDVPLELDLFLKTVRRSAGKTGREMLSSFVNDRIASIAVFHGIYANSLSELDLASLRQCVAHAVLNLDPPPNISGIDKQILDIPCTDTGRRIVLLNPLCRLAIMARYKDWSTKIALSTAAEYVFMNRQIPNGAKGMFAELYIASCLEMTNDYLLKCSEIKCWRGLRVFLSASHFQGRFMNTTYFDGISIPKSKSWVGNSTLLLPINSSYPHLDFFIWEAEEKRLLAFQVTVVHPVAEHMTRPNVQKFADLLKEWAAFLEIKVADVHVIWTAPDECLSKQYPDLSSLGTKNHILQFSSLYNLCPALRRLYLIPPAGTDLSRKALDERQLAKSYPWPF